MSIFGTNYLFQHLFTATKIIIFVVINDSTEIEFRCTFAFQHCRALIDCGLVPVLLNVLVCNDARLVEACLCCLRTLFSHSSDPPIDLLYADTNIIPHLIALMPLSTANQVLDHQTC